MAASKPKDTGLLRLQVVLARAGIASRRKSEELITSRRVTVNGKVVSKLGTRVNPNKDHVQVDGKPIAKAPSTMLYILLNKPKGVLTAVEDDRGRPVVRDLLRGIKERVYPVGRLDWNTEGVLLLTNDGDLTHKLMHPSYEVPRVYRVKVRGIPDTKTLIRLRRGIMLDDGRSPPALIKRLEDTGTNSWLEITVREGRNRLIRRMCQAVGHPVNKLERTSFGGLKTHGLKPGQWRYLLKTELTRLKRVPKVTKKKVTKKPAKKSPRKTMGKARGTSGRG